MDIWTIRKYEKYTASCVVCWTLGIGHGHVGCVGVLWKWQQKTTYSECMISCSSWKRIASCFRWASGYPNWGKILTITQDLALCQQAILFQFYCALNSQTSFQHLTFFLIEASQSLPFNDLSGLLLGPNTDTLSDFCSLFLTFFRVIPKGGDGLEFVASERLQIFIGIYIIYESRAKTHERFYIIEVHRHRFEMSARKVPFEKCTRWRKVCGRSAKDQIGDSIYSFFLQFRAKGSRKARERCAKDVSTRAMSCPK